MAGFKSPYKKQLNDITNRIINREKFQYDFNADALYNLYKNQYMMAGNTAMRDTVGNMAANTGGYASSAATAAGNSAYQSQLSALNAKIPELYQQSLNMYNQDTSDLYNQFGIINTLDQSAYQRYRDQVGDSYADKNYDLQKQQLANSESDAAWNRKYQERKFQYEREMDAKKKQYGL